MEGLDYFLESSFEYYKESFVNTIGDLKHLSGENVLKMGEIDQFLKDIYFFDLGLDEDYIYWLIATIPCLPLPPFVSKNHQNKYYFGLFDMELDMHPAVLYI